MAILYVKHTGSNTSTYDTWAKAATTIATAAGADAAGDTIYVADDHAESTAGAISLDWAGTQASPTKIIGGNDAAEPPTTAADTATITTTGNNAITTAAAGDVFYMRGINFIAGSGATGAAAIAHNGAYAVYENCTYYVASTGTGNIVASNTSGGFVQHINCGFKFGAAGKVISSASARIEIIGGSVLSGGVNTTNLFGNNNVAGVFSIDGFDMTNANSAINLVNGGSAGTKYTFRNCKLPASWSGAVSASTVNMGCTVEVINCDSGDTNYRYRKAAHTGDMQEETTLIRTGGASDGTTGYSMKMVTNTNAEYPMLTLDSPEIVKWNDTTGSAVTATIEILFDSATNLKDDEVWMEVMYLGTSGTPLALFVDDAKADVFATASDQSDSTETWTTTGMTNPNTRKLSVTFTPQEKGFVHAVVKCAKASQTLYYCEKMALT